MPSGNTTKPKNSKPKNSTKKPSYTSTIKSPGGRFNIPVLKGGRRRRRTRKY